MPVQQPDYSAGLSTLNEWEMDSLPKRFLKVKPLVLRMLRASDWYSPREFLASFSRVFSNSYKANHFQSIDDRVEKLVSSFRVIGWDGIPFIAANGDSALWSGAHRLEAIKRMLASGDIPQNFLVPVFDLYGEWDWFVYELPQKEREEIDYTLNLFSVKFLVRYNQPTVFQVVTGIDNW